MSLSLVRNRIFVACLLARNFNLKLFSNSRFKVFKRYPIKPLLLFSIPFFGNKKEEKPVMSDANQTTKPQYDKADELFDDNKFQEAFDFLKTFENQSDPETLWRLGRALFKITKQPTCSNKNEKIREAYGFLSEALEKDDKNFAIHKWYAILLDTKSHLDGIKERCIQIENVKKHMQIAVELNPKDPTSRYLLGLFAFGLADLPWYQRKIVSTIFAAPPEGTYEEALEHFLKAEELQADFFHMNKLMIGKCYYYLKNYEEAKKHLTKAANITVLNEDDREAKEESEKLLSKLK